MSSLSDYPIKNKSWLPWGPARGHPSRQKKFLDGWISLKREDSYNLEVFNQGQQITYLCSKDYFISSANEVFLKVYILQLSLLHIPFVFFIFYIPPSPFYFPLLFLLMLLYITIICVTFFLFFYSFFFVFFSLLSFPLLFLFYFFFLLLLLP